jgi:hypothetical protein
MNINISNLDTTIEHWASIDGYLNYQVSWWGRVTNTKTGRILKPGTSVPGYLFVILSKNGKKKLHYIHKLVAREWRANPDERPCVDHVDNDKSNNNHENLRWATLSENSRNMKKHKDGSSDFKGVSLEKKSGKWRARILLPGKPLHLGCFTNEREAAESYNIAAVKYYKQFAKLNVFED